LIPASGLYEWQKQGTGRKQPFFISLRDGEPFSFAGLWERWHDPEGEVVAHEKNSDMLFGPTYVRQDAGSGHDEKDKLGRALEIPPGSRATSVGSLSSNPEIAEGFRVSFMDAMPPQAATSLV
jgi:hypothetical protein